MPFLVGDIGGTKTELALYDSAATGARPVGVERYASREFDGLSAVVARFLAEHAHGPIQSAAFGVAGPIIDQRCRTTNLPWVVAGDQLATALDCPVRLVNDFAAVALGVGDLQSDQLHVLWEGKRQPDGPMAVLGAGTGLGEATVVPLPGGQRVLPSEGGHTDFAPRSNIEMALLRFLQRRHGRVSVERVVSGPGLGALFDFVVDSDQAMPMPDTIAALEEADRAAVIGQRGLDGSDPACRKALELFVDAYGAEAGNFALKVLPTGGLFVAGGIAPKILPALRDGRFLQSLFDKGRMRPVLEQLPIAVVLEPRVALVGCLRTAAELAGTRPSGAGS